MSFFLRFRARARLLALPALLAGGCAIAAPAVEDDDFFAENGKDDAGAVDAALVDADAVDPGPIDSGNVLPPFGSFAGLTGGTAGGAPGGTTGGVMPARDAGPARDASTGPRDASTGRPTTPTRDAAPPPASAGCNVLTCTNECSVAGPFPCCTLLDTCGCTWAPGAYCL